MTSFQTPAGQALRDANARDSSVRERARQQRARVSSSAACGNGWAEMAGANMCARTQCMTRGSKGAACRRVRMYRTIVCVPGY